MNNFMPSGVSPSINLPRTKRPFKCQVSTTLEHGRLVPIYCERVIPGNELNLNVASLIRMSTPILPIMSDISFELDCFFVPLRQIWVHAEHFFGAKTSQIGGNKITPDVSTTTYLVPYDSVYTSGITATSLSHYLGKPICSYSDSKKGAYGFATPLKERGYYHIWNTFYRAKKIQNPVLIATGGNGKNTYSQTEFIGFDGSTPLGFNSGCKKVNKVFDYFTTSLLTPEAFAVTLPLGSYAPVMVSNNNESGSIAANTALANTTAVVAGASAGVGLSGYTAKTNAFADLSQATAASVDDLRYALSIEHYLQRMEYAGDDFQSILLAQFGTSNGNRSLQLPEHLGRIKFKINISQVTAMADTTQTIGGQTAVKPAGSSAAVSITGNKGHICAKSFGEPGYFYILAFARQDNQLYSQGLLREDFEFDIHSWFNPSFAFIHDQKVYNKEIMLTGDTTDDSVFGYQAAWESERRQINRVSGYLDPAVSNSIAPWTLANKFTTRPNLSSAFIEEDRSMLARALTTGDLGPDYIADFWITGTKTSLVPSEGVPGISGNMKI